MALTVKHLNDDASFLLSFEPVQRGLSTRRQREPFRILLDPWITGPSSIFHPKISVSQPRNQACITSLAELPEPDLVIITQHMTDHCNEATLRQLPATGTKTVILAEPTSARLIQSWKYFEKTKVQTIHKWEDPTTAGRDSVVRIPLKPEVEGGQAGEVTISFIPQPKDISGLLNAVAITYRPPSTSPTQAVPGWTPSSPAMSAPKRLASHKSYTQLPRLFSYSSNLPSPGELSPLTPSSPGFFSLRSARSTSSINTAATTITIPAATTITIPAADPSDPARPSPALSVIFAPHGISYASLHRFATSHLAAESALPLTALLHCFDRISNPWWLGGTVLLGAPAGMETASRLQARTWISAHDGDKEVRGLATGFLRTSKWARDDLARQLQERVESGEKMDGVLRGAGREQQQQQQQQQGTKVMTLRIGEELLLDREGVCDAAKNGAVQTMDRTPICKEKDIDRGFHRVTEFVGH